MVDRSRRTFVIASFASVSTPIWAQSDVNSDDTTEIEQEITKTQRRNLSSFRALDWRPYFSNLKNGAILVDMTSRALHFWSEDENIYNLYPSSVPMSDELTRRGRTKVVKKVEGPSWRPTPSMLERNPEWPEFMPPGPENPLGTHALYLSWQYYRIHGTHDTRKLGADPQMVALDYTRTYYELFSLTKVGHRYYLFEVHL